MCHNKLNVAIDLIKNHPYSRLWGITTKYTLPYAELSTIPTADYGP
jgi:hypothetical protein